MKEMIDYPYITFGVSRRRRAYQVPDRRALSDRRHRNVSCASSRWLTLEDIHWRLSALPAFCAGFKDRGFLREGAPADIVIYDFEKLGVLPVEIVHDLPGNEWRRVQRAEGYSHILVNGEVTFTEGDCTGATPGKLLRHGVAA